ncbi:alcohol dehydrogenase [Diplocarpon rosae]|nr:alcohol dehydrogenase [Diplocarpon rosae]
MVEFTVFKGSKEGRIVQSQTKKEIKADEVLIKVTHSGLCGTDEHFKCVDMVLGHEGVGVVEMGCHVTVFSSTNRKRDEALKLGANEFVATKGAESLEVSDKIDQLLICSSVMPDWKQFLPIMAPAGTLYPLTVAAGDLTIPYPPLLEQQLNIQGSLVAARSVHKEMLGFAALHQIRPVIEEFPMTVEGIETSMKKLAEGKMRYRGVLVAP